MNALGTTFPPEGPDRSEDEPTLPTHDTLDPGVERAASENTEFDDEELGGNS